MKIYIVQSDYNKRKLFGDTLDNCPIPRKGEGIFLGYEPASVVIGVVYYKTEVYVLVDGIILDE
jgi:hypothetical protein